MPSPVTAKSLPKEITLLLGSTAFMTFQLNFKLSICKTAVIVLRPRSQVLKKFLFSLTVIHMKSLVASF